MELELRDVHVERGGRPVLRGVNLRIGAGERIAVMGANGAGKSTLALTLAGVLVPGSGSITGSAVGEVRAVLQRPELTFLTERVLDEVALGAQWLGSRDPHAAARRALGALAIGDELLERDPLSLSGGEQRRVAIAAVLATSPRVLVLDEPSAGLDGTGRMALHDAVGAVAATGAATMTITHDPDEAARVADRLVVFEHGRVAWDGPLAAVLGVPETALRLGLPVADEVSVLRAAAASRGAEVGAVAHPDEALRIARQILAGTRARTAPRADSQSHHAPRPRTVQHEGFDARAVLPAAIDARARIAAATAAAAAALAADTLVVAAVVALATLLLLLVAPVPWRQRRAVLRSIIVLAMVLVAAQFIIGRDVHVELVAGVERSSPILVALHRIAQITGVLVASLLLTSATRPSDLGFAIRRLLAPLRRLTPRVDDVALVTATALSLVPSLDRELLRIREARDARGIRPRTSSLLARVRADALLLVPLLVSSFRRAGTLADALAARGADPRAVVRPWRPHRVPVLDLALLAFAIMLFVVAWST